MVLWFSQCSVKPAGFFIWNILTCRKNIFVFICIAWWKFLSVWLLSPMLSYISRSSCLWTPAAAAASLHSAAELSLWHTNVWTCPSFSLPMKILTSSAFLLLLSPMHTSSLPGSFPPASVAAVADLLTLTKTRLLCNIYVTLQNASGLPVVDTDGQEAVILWTVPLSYY